MCIKYIPYITSKPARCGIEMLVIRHAITFYTSKILVYVGKQPSGPYYEVSNSLIIIVKILVKRVLNS